MYVLSQNADKIKFYAFVNFNSYLVRGLSYFVVIQMQGLLYAINKPLSLQYDKLGQNLT